MSSVHENCKLRTCSECQNKNKKQFMCTKCSELVIFMYWTCSSMNNLLSYYGSVDARISSEKDLLACTYVIYQLFRAGYKVLTKNQKNWFAFNRFQRIWFLMSYWKKTLCTNSFMTGCDLLANLWIEPKKDGRNVRAPVKICLVVIADTSSSPSKFWKIFNVSLWLGLRPLYHISKSPPHSTRAPFKTWPNSKTIEPVIINEC